MDTFHRLIRCIDMSGMHLMPVYYNSNSTRKKKKKKVNPQKYETQWRAHNKFLKSIRCSVVTLEEYVDYVQGKAPKSKGVKCYGSTSDSKPLGRGSIPCTPANNIPSVGNGIGNAYKQEIPVYTGNAVIGQAYNKGGLQVLSTQEANDPDTGKRR